MFVSRSLQEKIRAVYTRVRNYVFPHYRWLTRRLGRAPLPKEEVIAQTLYGALVTYWEHPDGGNRLRSYAFDPQSVKEGEDNRKAYLELKAAYEWAQIRPDKKAEVDELHTRFCAVNFPSVYPDVDISDTFFDYQIADLGKTLTEKTEEFRKHDTTYMDLILSNRQRLTV